jgi:hypothetical protein
MWSYTNTRTERHTKHCSFEGYSWPGKPGIIASMGQIIFPITENHLNERSASMDKKLFLFCKRTECKSKLQCAVAVILADDQGDQTSL